MSYKEDHIAEARQVQETLDTLWNYVELDDNTAIIGDLSISYATGYGYIHVDHVVHGRVYQAWDSAPRLFHTGTWVQTLYDYLGEKILEKDDAWKPLDEK